jgi:hypothetical protein
MSCFFAVRTDFFKYYLDGQEVKLELVCLKAGLLVRRQYESRRSSDGETWARFSVVLLSPWANAVLVPKSHVTLHASDAARPILISKFNPSVASPVLK